MEELGSFITDKAVSTREKGINSLSSILSHLSKEYLNENELSFVTSFYCDRLKDHHSIIPSALKGILAIVSALKYLLIICKKTEKYYIVISGSNETFASKFT